MIVQEGNTFVQLDVQFEFCNSRHVLNLFVCVWTEGGTIIEMSLFLMSTFVTQLRFSCNVFLTNVSYIDAVPRADHGALGEVW